MALLSTLVSTTFVLLGQPVAANAATSNNEIAFNFFVAQGLPTFQAAAILGNFDLESCCNLGTDADGAPQMDPGSVQSNGPGRGIGQWGTGGRWDTYASDNCVWYAGTLGLSAWDLSAQLQFTWYELTHIGYGYSAFRATTNSSDATKVFEDDFERPLDPSSTLTTRQQYAADALSYYGQGAATATTAVAFQAQGPNGYLYTWSGTPDKLGSALSANVGMMPGTSPSIASMGGGQYAVAFQANTGVLYTWKGTPGTIGQAASAKVSMMKGTSPSIAIGGNGQAIVALQYTTGELWTWKGPPGDPNNAGSAAPTHLGMMNGTSPSITTWGSGQAAVAFQANTKYLWTWQGPPGDNTNPGNGNSSQVTMNSTSSPSIANMGNGKVGVAFMASGSGGYMYTWAGIPGDTTKNAWHSTSSLDGMMSGTSPSITSMGNGQAAVAFQANTGYLYTWLGLPDSQGSAKSENVTMSSATSPSITNVGSGQAAVAFHASGSTGYLYTWIGVPGTFAASKNQVTGIVASTSPGIA